VAILAVSAIGRPAGLAFSGWPPACNGSPAMKTEYDDEHEDLERPRVEVRSLGPEDLPWVVAIDETHTGRARVEYYRLALERAAKDTGVRISLAAWVEGAPVGFVIARLYYGEFGRPEPAAILDAIGVAESATKQGVGRALLDTLRRHLAAIDVGLIQTEVDWRDRRLVAFFNAAGFALAPRLCLELPFDTRAR